MRSMDRMITHARRQRHTQARHHPRARIITSSSMVAERQSLVKPLVALGVRALDASAERLGAVPPALQARVVPSHAVVAQERVAGVVERAVAVHADRAAGDVGLEVVLHPELQARPAPVVSLALVDTAEGARAAALELRRHEHLRRVPRLPAGRSRGLVLGAHAAGAAADLELPRRLALVVHRGLGGELQRRQLRGLDLGRGAQGRHVCAELVPRSQIHLGAAVQDGRSQLAEVGRRREPDGVQLQGLVAALLAGRGDRHLGIPANLDPAGDAPLRGVLAVGRDRRLAPTDGGGEAAGETLGALELQKGGVGVLALAVSRGAQLVRGRALDVRSGDLALQPGLVLQRCVRKIWIGLVHVHGRIANRRGVAESRAVAVPRWQGAIRAGAALRIDGVAHGKALRHGRLQAEGAVVDHAAPVAGRGEVPALVALDVQRPVHVRRIPVAV
mmetsp:Transcript_88100/g.233911  ORF Transcript_88100/g.233911 Transcript_88100/m.233911 type:complete len:446 (+) Transcript_88100:197-1534(+)